MSLQDEITAANKKFMSFFDNGDAKGVSSLYTEDCKIMPTGMPMQTGRDAVAKVFGSVMTDMGAKKVILAIQEVGPLTPGPDMAYERSTYEFFDDKGATIDNGKYVVIWKKVNGEWFLYTDIFNTNVAPSQK
jgi:uncharacterized protein (TIGR02246 family)